MRQQAWYALLIATGGALASACSSSPAKRQTAPTSALAARPNPLSTTTTGPTLRSTTTSTAPPGCQLDELDVTMKGPTGAGGTLYLTLVFTNQAQRTCIMTGYPGVAAVFSSISTEQAKRSPTGASPPVTHLSPGQSVSTYIRAGDVPQDGAYSCPRVEHLVVTPPGETHSASIIPPYNFSPCTSIYVYPLYPGASGSPV